MADAVKRIKLQLDAAQFQKELTSTRRDLNRLSSGFRQLGGIIGVAFATDTLIQFGREAVDLAGKAEGIERAFNRVGDARLLKGLEQATRNTVSQLELMRQSVRAANFQIPLQDLATYFEFATRRAEETGESVDYLVNSIIDGIGRKSTLVMDNLGISAAQLQGEIKKTGDFAVAAGNLIREGLGEMGERGPETTANQVMQLTKEIEDLKVEIGQGLLPVYRDFLMLSKGFIDAARSLSRGGGQRQLERNIELFERWNLAYDRNTIITEGYNEQQKQLIETGELVTDAMQAGRDALEAYNKELEKSDTVADKFAKTILKLKAVDFIPSEQIAQLRSDAEAIAAALRGNLSKVGTPAGLPAPILPFSGPNGGYDPYMQTMTGAAYAPDELIDPLDDTAKNTGSLIDQQALTIQAINSSASLISAALRGDLSEGGALGGIGAALDLAAPVVAAFNPLLGAGVGAIGGLLTSINGSQINVVNNRTQFQNGITYG